MIDIKRLAEADQLTMGTQTTVKALNKGGLQKIYLADNALATTKTDIEHAAKLAKVPVEILNVNNQDLGTMCKRTHAISVLGHRK
jgi:ribosomal protein L30E